MLTRWTITVAVAIGLVLPALVAGRATSLPEVFADGQVASAAAVNANFSELAAAIDDNDDRLDAIEGEALTLTGTKTLSGGLKLGAPSSCTSAEEGLLRTDLASRNVQVCDGNGQWISVVTWAPCGGMSEVKSVNSAGVITCRNDSLVSGNATSSSLGNGGHCGSGTFDWRCEGHSHNSAPGCVTYASVCGVTFTWRGATFSTSTQCRTNVSGAAPAYCTW